MAIQLYSENHGFCFNQDIIEDDGYGLNDYSVLLQQQKQQYVQEQSNQENMYYGNNTSQLFDFSQGVIESAFEKQMQEIGHFITVQNERLRLVLQEQRKYQLATLVKKYETRAQILFKEKDEEIAKAVNRTMELEDYLNKMEIQRQTWQKLAKENEGMVNSLTQTIQHVKETNSCIIANGVGDAESCCETGENRGHENRVLLQEQGSTLVICRSCNSKNSCFILLPCRHFCSCKDCEPFLDSCPVCGMLKNTSIEVLV